LVDIKQKHSIDEFDVLLINVGATILLHCSVYYYLDSGFPAIISWLKLYTNSAPRTVENIKVCAAECKVAKEPYYPR